MSRRHRASFPSTSGTRHGHRRIGFIHRRRRSPHHAQQAVPQLGRVPQWRPRERGSQPRSPDHCHLPHAHEVASEEDGVGVTDYEIHEGSTLRRYYVWVRIGWLFFACTQSVSCFFFFRASFFVFANFFPFFFLQLDAITHGIEPNFAFYLVRRLLPFPLAIKMTKTVM
jgi:hypothetical protein